MIYKSQRDKRYWSQMIEVPEFPYLVISVFNTRNLVGTRTFEGRGSAGVRLFGCGGFN